MNTFDPKYPFQTKSGKEVTILTFESRKVGLPIMGYIGEDTALSMWDKDGIPQYGYEFSPDRLVNKPLTGVLYAVNFKDGQVLFFPESQADDIPRYDLSVNNPIIAVKKVEYSATPGQRDDKTDLEERAANAILEIAKSDASKTEVETPTLDALVQEFSSEPKNGS